MKKRMMHVGLLGFILTIALGLNITPTSAAENISIKSMPASSLSADNDEMNEIEPYAISRQISNYRVSFKSIPPVRYAYTDSIGYIGSLKRTGYIKSGRGYIGLYAGTVYCEGTCPAPVNVSLDEK